MTKGSVKDKHTLYIPRIVFCVYVKPLYGTNEGVGSVYEGNFSYASDVENVEKCDPCDSSIGNSFVFFSYSTGSGGFLRYGAELAILEEVLREGALARALP